MGRNKLLPTPAEDSGVRRGTWTTTPVGNLVGNNRQIQIVSFGCEVQGPNK